MCVCIILYLHIQRFRKIWLYPSGYLNGKTMSLYLKLDSFGMLPQGFKAYAEYEIAVFRYKKIVELALFRYNN